MSTLREQFSAVRKAQVETQLDFVRNLTSKVVENAGKVVALNVTANRSAFEQSTNTLRQLLTAQSPADLASLATPQAGFKSFLSYGSELFNIVSRVQTDLINTATPAALAPGLKALPSGKVEVEVQAEVADPLELAAFNASEIVEVETPVLSAQAEPAAEFVAEPAVEFVAEPAAEFVAEPAVEPAVESKVAAAQPAAAQIPEAQQVQAAPAIDVAEEVPVPGHAFQETVLSRAISDIVEQAEAPVLAASPLVTTDAPELKITGIAPVDAVAPHVQATGNPFAQDKPAENGGTKSRRKK